MSGFMTYFGGDSTGFMRTVKGMEGAISKMGSKMSGDMKSAIGGFVGYEAFKHLVSSVIESTSAIYNFAKQQNITYEGAQRLGKAAKESGQTMEDFGTVLNKLAGSREAAASSDDKMLNTFSKFGITMSELQDPLVSNYDLIVKIGKALQNMKIDAATQAAFRELFGRSGSQMIASLKELGMQKPITLIEDSDIERIHKMERSLERLNSQYKKIAAGPIATIGNFWTSLGGLMFDDNVTEKFTRVSSMFQKYMDAHPEHAESALEGYKDFYTVSLYQGGDTEEANDAIVNLAHNSLMRHGEAETKSIFKEYADVAIENVDNAKSKKSKKGLEKLFVDERSKGLRNEELKLSEMIGKSELDKLQPAQRALELRRQATQEISRALMLEEMGLSIADEVEAVKARQNALQLNDQAYGIENKQGGGGSSRSDKMVIDEMAKNNLSLGIKAYEPMMSATTINTTATISNTEALNKNGQMISNILSTVTISAWD